MGWSSPGPAPLPEAPNPEPRAPSPSPSLSPSLSSSPSPSPSPSLYCIRLQPRVHGLQVSAADVTAAFADLTAARAGLGAVGGLLDKGDFAGVTSLLAAPPFASAKASAITYGHILHHVRLQPLLNTIAASVKHGCSLYYVRWQPLLRTAAGEPLRDRARPDAGRRREESHRQREALRWPLPHDTAPTYDSA